MRHESRLILFTPFLMILGLIALNATPAMAVGLVNGCGVFAGTSDWKLNASFASTNADACVTIQGGKNLDTNGKTITCNRSGGCGPAVQCDDASGVSSIIQGTSNDTVNDIVNGTGTFSSGVKNCGTVKELKIVNATTGILWTNAGNNGKAYQRNVIQSPAGGTGINMTLLDAADVIENNRIDGGSVGIQIAGKSSATGPMVQKNMVRGYTYAGLYSTDRTYFRLENNVVVEGSDASVPFAISSGHASFTHNICEDAGGATIGAVCSCELDDLVPPAYPNTLSCL